MAGLLDMFSGEEGLLGALALMSAGSAKRERTSLADGLLGSMQVMQQAKTSREDRAMRQQQMEMQRQQQALQLQQMQRQAQQQDTDTNALRGLFQPLPGPTQDGSQLRRGFDPAGMLQAGASPQALQQAMQLDQMVNPRAKPAEFKEVGGHLVRIGGDGQVAPAWSPPAKPQEDEFTRALTAAGLDPNSPQARALALARLRKMSSHAPGVSVSYGAPVAGQDESGRPVFFQPSKDGRAPAIIPGVRPPARPLGEGAQKQVNGIDSLGSAIDEYTAALDKWDPRDILNPSKRNEIGTYYNNMMLQAKEAYNLGVLNGPDYEILQKVVRDPVTLGGAVSTKDSLKLQANNLKRLMNKTRAAVTKQPAGQSQADVMSEADRILGGN